MISLWARPGGVGWPATAAGGCLGACEAFNPFNETFAVLIGYLNDTVAGKTEAVAGNTPGDEVNVAAAIVGLNAPDCSLGGDRLFARFFPERFFFELLTGTSCDPLNLNGPGCSSDFISLVAVSWWFLCDCDPLSPVPFSSPLSSWGGSPVGMSTKCILASSLIMAAAPPGVTPSFEDKFHCLIPANTSLYFFLSAGLFEMLSLFKNDIKSGL
jgi:hypothetical protein